jgi:regulator of protease activity HflC (stomatin/prohibitin superfamily)
MEPVRKLSVSMPPETIEEIRRSAAAEGMTVSAWLAAAAQAAADRQATLAVGRAAVAEMLAEYEAEHGPVPAQARARARDFLDALAGEERARLRDAG